MRGKDDFGFTEKLDDNLLADTSPDDTEVDFSKMLFLFL
jgi:hypothetical protein